MKQLMKAILAFACTMFALGCDQQGNFSEEPALSKLAKGISSEGDVRNAMGKPDTVWEEENGERVLEYPRGPNGVKTWMFDIGRDGKLRDWRQVLNDESFRRVRPGMSMDEVRRLLGRPRSTVQFRNRSEEVWDWLYQEGGTRRLFQVHFDIGSRQVRMSTTADDPDIRP
jgi:outer membrane protein assembly factor BamE (lipoprotein component of BamABCDE complex)